VPNLALLSRNRKEFVTVCDDLIPRVRAREPRAGRRSVGLCSSCPVLLSGIPLDGCGFAKPSGETRYDPSGVFPGNHEHES
jgi:hypothetical protein